MLSRAAWISAFLLLACSADAAPTPYDDDGAPAWISAMLEEQLMLLDPVLGASMLAGTMLAGWNSHLRRQIAKRVREERALRAAAQSAESACRAKSDFLAVASHEIRTPLHAVAGMLELGLKEAAAGQDVQDHLRVAHGAAQGLLDLIRDILDLEKMDCGKLELLPQRTNLRALTQSVVQVFQGMARDKGLPLRFEADDEVDADVLVDPMRVRQILSNLISNAVKFTRAGHVTVRLRARRTDTMRLAVSLQVMDTGIGISAADQRKLFAPYTQTSDGARVHGGSGLGLNIARRLAALMDGTLRLDSVPGRGCTARFDFQADIVATRPEMHTASQRGGDDALPLQILVADDNPPSRLLLRKQLEYLGHQVVQACSGRAAWRLWRPGAYHLVITDCNMAEGSGYDLARRIRGAESTLGVAPCSIWAYTAGTEQDEMARCTDAGMDACLFKPVSLPELQRRLSATPRTHANLHDAWRQGLRFDPGAIETLAAGDSAIADRFLAALRETSEQDAAALRQALDRRDPTAAGDVLHALTGVARMIGATVLADTCVAAQQALARDGVAAAADACRIAQEELSLLTRSVRAWTEGGP
ncbi:histidine kinase [Bordetella sputigena]|uniref:sensor histidine kinase n=1 Tax=Bordetella sputigena TaxID=1416810 RepID=UPI0039EE1F6F